MNSADQPSLRPTPSALLIPSDSAWPSMRAALERAQWRVTTVTPGQLADAGAVYDLILVQDVRRVPPEIIHACQCPDTLTSGIALGITSPQFAAGYDVLFCADRTETEVLRRLGNAVHHYDLRTRSDETCLEILERHIRYRRERYPAVEWARISYGHSQITSDQVTGGMLTAWQSEDIPARQRALVQTELDEMYRGRVPKVYQVLADAVQPYAEEGLEVLEIGCASGYYSEILEYLVGPLTYTGVDYSEPLIRMARSIYPRTSFRVADGARLPFEDRAFAIVISSGVLLHVPNFRDHVREAARVSAKRLIAHRTPVCRRNPTQFQRKFAYGIETVELVFNEAEILADFRDNGFALIDRDEFGASPEQDQYAVTYTFERSVG